MSKLNDMVESIKEYGILSPVIAREIEDQEELELLRGYNRVNAAKIIGLETVPTIIKNVDDDTAQIIVAEANFMQRQDFLPSERAKAYKMQIDALNRQGKKREIDICSNGTYVETSREEVAKNNDTSASQIRRYIRLNYLTDELLDMADKNILGFRPAVEISYLSLKSQKIIESLIKNQNTKISLKKAETLKIKEREIGRMKPVGLTYKEIDVILYPEIEIEENQEEQEPVGKYGLLAMNYLREINQQRYTEMFMNGELMQIMRKVNEEAHELLDSIMEQKLKIDPVPDPMNAYESYKHRDMIKIEAEEIVLKEIVYQKR